MPELTQFPRGRGSLARITAGDLLNRNGASVDVLDDSVSADDTLIAGELLHQELRPGLQIHLSNAREEHPFSATSQIREGLSCIFFIEGDVEIGMGDRRFSFRGAKHRPIEGTAIVCTRADSFERRSHAAQRLRHLVVSASPEWLDLDGLRQATDRSRLMSVFKDHLYSHRWGATARTSELVHQIASSSYYLPELRNLYLEGRAVDLVCETLYALAKDGTLATHAGIVTRREMSHLDRAREFIRANLASPLTVEIIARQAGLNPSSLQLLFRSVEGVSIFEYVRKLRLEQAFAMLQSGECTVAQASVVAGYASPTNFATAFQRRFGLAPRQALPKNQRIP